MKTARYIEATEEYINKTAPLIIHIKLVLLALLINLIKYV
jgi:hypothetical protein